MNQVNPLRIEVNAEFTVVKNSSLLLFTVC